MWRDIPVILDNAFCIRPAPIKQQGMPPVKMAQYQASGVALQVVNSMFEYLLDWLISRCISAANSG